jgi:hypothetical protein
MRLSSRIALHLPPLTHGWVAAFVMTALVAAGCVSQLAADRQRGVSAAPIRLARVEQFPPLASDWQLLDW